MELLAPAGNLEKLEAAYRYGADAAYAGVESFSLRARADNFDLSDPDSVARVKGERELYCALNVYFHEADLARLEERMEAIAAFPFDAFIVSDPGIIPLLRRHVPEAELHLSTQANCVNSEAAKFYRDIGFSRIVLGRELSLDEIAAIRTSVPDVELEAFVHGAMCLAYSGRCFLSAWMVDRSANRGGCAHSCRWTYRPQDRLYFIEEEKRRGEFYPVIEGENFTSILSSKDIRMIDYLAEMRDAGIDVLKIEGRMKSAYYTAVVTRAYRKQLDHVLTGSPAADEVAAFVAELDKVSRRESSTGFYFGREEVEVPTETEYSRDYTFLGTVGAERSPGCYELHLKNRIEAGMRLELLGPHLPFIEDDAFELLDEKGAATAAINHNARGFIRPGVAVEPGYLIRIYRPDAPN